jgi:hypothetical protein
VISGCLTYLLPAPPHVHVVIWPQAELWQIEPALDPAGAVDSGASQPQHPRGLSSEDVVETLRTVGGMTTAELVRALPQALQEVRCVHCWSPTAGARRGLHNNALTN